MAELWQMAARWLNVAGVLPPDSPALARNGKVYDFALALQDGVILCNTVNRIHPNAIKQINQKPEKQFLKMQNINSFLSTCVAIFGLKPTDLFTADELYYASNFSKVVHTLSLLSKTQLAGLCGFQYFPKENESAENKAEEDGEDMYHNLEDLVGQCLSLEETAVSMPTLSTMPEERHESEDIYGALQKVVDDASGGVVADEVYTDLLYTHGEAIYSPGTSSQDEKRNCVLAELQDTERNYVKLLKMIIDVFMRVLSSNPKAVSKGECKAIFSNVEELHAAHTLFIDKLDKHLSSHTGRIVSGCFLEAIKSFRCYGQFCCDIPDAIKTLQALAERPAAAKLLDQAVKESSQRFALKDLLNVPMQRILKYPLLLKELIKYTAPSHADKEGLRNALLAVEDLAKFIDSTKKDHDYLKNMVASLKQYSGRPIRSYGVLVKDGDLTYKCDATKARLKLRYVFLFNLGVICCKAKGPFYHFKAAIDLDQMDYEIEDVPTATLSKSEQEGKHSFYWMLRGKKGSSEVSHVFAAKSQAAKKKWVAEMKLQLQTLRDRKAAPPDTLPRGMAMMSPAAAAAPEAPRSRPESRGSMPLPATPKEVSSPTKQSYEQWVIGSGPAPSSISSSKKDSLPPLPPPPPASPPVVVGVDDERWFAGRMPRLEADQLLEAMPNGTYMVRESDSRPGDYSLSVAYGHVKHIKINRRGNKYEVAPDSKAFSSIHDLVSHFQQHSLNRHFPGMETTLAIPFRDALSRGAGFVPGTSSRILGVGRARSRFAYIAKSHDELSFDRGVELIIISMDDVDPGWWRGALPDGRVGVFPANYVQQI